MTWLKREWTILWSSHRKWSVALLALAGTLLDQGLVHGTAAHDIQVGIALLTALGVRAVPNVSPEG